MKGTFASFLAILLGSMLSDATSVHAQPKPAPALPPAVDSILAAAKSRADAMIATMKHRSDSLNAEIKRGGSNWSFSSDTVWIPLKASEWKAKSPKLLGRSVEVSGDLSTLMIVGRTGLYNSGWMRDADNRLLLTVSFKQADDRQLAWMTKHKCRETCSGVFVRGTVVSREDLLMKEVSYESKVGVAPAGVAIPEVAANDSASGGPKLLLPSGTVPPEESPRWATKVPLDSQEVASSQSMTSRSDYIRQRDLNMQKGRIPGPERPADFATPYRSIRDTRLRNVFAAYPWNGDQTLWPRVAIIVEEVTNGGTRFFTYKRSGESIEDRCWRLSARLWKGPANSEDVAPFNWCLSEMRFNVSYEGVALWAGTPKTSMSRHAIGPPGTTGPNPPYLPAAEHHFNDGYNSDTIMLGNILLDMGFSFGVPDGRVWVVDNGKKSP